jgi:hypothetical protein
MIICPFELLVISPVDRENLAVEINFDGQGVAEISQEVMGEFKVEIYPKREGGPWLFDCKEFQTALDIAVTRLRDGG